MKKPERHYYQDIIIAPEDVADVFGIRLIDEETKALAMETYEYSINTKEKEKEVEAIAQIKITGTTARMLAGKGTTRREAISQLCDTVEKHAVYDLIRERLRRELLAREEKKDAK
jgi:hypothetical protein